MEDERPDQLAHLEMLSWQCHHRKDKVGFVQALTQFYALKFRVDEKVAARAALLWVKAATFHDKAEKYEDEGDQERADIFWAKAKNCLRQHHKIIQNYRGIKN